MCCFSGKVKTVKSTRIFARDGEKGMQYIVYSMHLDTDKDVSMILPLPTPKASAEDAVKFIDLSVYPKFFEEMENGFPKPKTRAPQRKPEKTFGGEPLALKVIEVGSFEASFVPTVKDFERLDERFRLPASTWDKLPQYKDSGFAVFKLKPGNRKIHPMAFQFPRMDAKKLFFPTVHIHDGEVHKTADFDHILYCQLSLDLDDPRGGLFDWEESPALAESFMKIRASRGIVHGELHCRKRVLAGMLKNADVLV